ncbi:Metabotropic glutamate receptor [Apis cerana cerana]|uniref:Metabotropic glutamate receptor n=1 Tax=Apis cerana cerana TaxID=94128 RepID=A0A2A3E934_APICC|nr:Metabotropic glutamate receptor [Apis cerana cerana]
MNSDSCHTIKLPKVNQGYKTCKFCKQDKDNIIEQDNRPIVLKSTLIQNSWIILGGNVSRLQRGGHVCVSAKVKQARSISNIDGAEDHCNKTAVRKVISGVVGAASSVTSIQVANLLRLFRIPQGIRWLHISEYKINSNKKSSLITSHDSLSKHTKPSLIILIPSTTIIQQATIFLHRSHFSLFTHFVPYKEHYREASEHTLQVSFVSVEVNNTRKNPLFGDRIENSKSDSFLREFRRKKIKVLAYIGKVFVRRDNAKIRKSLMSIAFRKDETKSKEIRKNFQEFIDTSTFPPFSRNTRAKPWNNVKSRFNIDTQNWKMKQEMKFQGNLISLELEMEMVELFRFYEVSFFSTSPELSNKQRFEYFTRTIPSDHYQVKAMVEIVMKMKWSYVSIIYEESNYGIKAFEELEELLGKRNICIAIKEKLVKDSGVAKDAAYDNIVLKLLTKPRARGCIIFGSDQEVAGVMRAVKRCNATGAFSWIGSDGWSARGLVSDGNEAEVEGTLSVQPQANPVKGFEEYFLNLTVENNRRNPWFVGVMYYNAICEFWEHHFQCRYPNASITPYNKNYTKFCTTEKRLTKQNTAFENQLQFVSDAVMAFAYAFRDMHKELCDGKPGLCDAMKPTKGTELLKYLRKVDFEAIQFKLGHPEPPESVCSPPCEVGQAKKYVAGEQCCWHCFNCTQYQIRDHKDVTQCISCRQGTVPDETHSACRDIPEEFLRPESGWAIGAMSFSATGILITLFVCGVFLKHNDTPVVRASGRELSYVLLSGILLCYLVTFALVLRPTDIVCGIQRFAAGFCFTVVYAALLTKTNRISRIFNASKHSAKRPSFISPRSQLIICSGLVFVQILVNGVWMIIDPAKAMHHYPTREDNLLVCNSYIDASYMIAFAYPIMLIVVCTVYAVLTRKIPEAFNESKHIGFTMYTTCVIWLAFVPLYFGTGNNVALRITSMSVTISLSASVTIACLFSPKKETCVKA